MGFISEKSFFAALLLCVFAIGTSARAQEKIQEKIRVFVSILPEVYFAERVGGERVAAEALVRPGQSAETYQPNPRQMAALGQARLYLAIGVPFETVWLSRIRQANPALRVVDISQGLPRRPMETFRHLLAEEGLAPGEEAGHQHHEGELDPHLWLDPLAVKKMAEKISQALSELDPAGKATYEANLKRFQDELDAADREIQQELRGIKNRKFMIYHPALGYFAERYGLSQIPIQIEGKDPSARMLAEIIRIAKQEGIRVIFVQQQFSTRSAQTVAQAIGGRVAPIDDLAPDYLANLRRIARTIAEAGGHQTQTP